MATWGEVRLVLGQLGLENTRGEIFAGVLSLPSGREQVVTVELEEKQRDSVLIASPFAEVDSADLRTVLALSFSPFGTISNGMGILAVCSCFPFEPMPSGPPLQSTLNWYMQFVALRADLIEQQMSPWRDKY